MKTVCVYCSSSNDIDETYLIDTQGIGKFLGRNNINVVYGGSDRGLMGAIAKSASEEGSKITGVITKDILNRTSKKTFGELIVVESMHKRKQKMFDLADMFLVLPGGVGTFDECFEVLTWRMLGYHNKPIAFCNLQGYFDHLIAFLKQAKEKKFIPEKEKFIFLNDIKDLTSWI